jgi:hypothetical protein
MQWSDQVLQTQANEIDELYNKSRPLRWSREMETMWMVMVTLKVMVMARGYKICVIFFNKGTL